MKFIQITLALTAVLSTAAAQGLNDLPPCAATCVTGALPPKCGLDPACICKSTSFLNDMACCVAGKCSPKDQEATVKAAKAICAPAGVTNLPDTLECSSAGSNSTASQTTMSGSMTANATATETMASSTAASSAASASSMTPSASSSAPAAATSTGAAVLGQTKDSSLMAAAGAAAAFAILI